MDSELRYVAQLTFTHDPLIGLVDAFHLILKFAVTFWPPGMFRLGEGVRNTV
jgi:hypothetical protein